MRMHIHVICNADYKFSWLQEHAEHQNSASVVHTVAHFLNFVVLYLRLYVDSHFLHNIHLNYRWTVTLIELIHKISAEVRIIIVGK